MIIRQPRITTKRSIHMIALKLKLHPSICERFPDFSAGGFLVTHLDRAGPTLPAIAQTQMAAAQAELQTQGLTIQNLANDPRIHAWRDAYGRSGLKPSTYKSSPEQLARRLLRGELINTPIPLVNTYCAVASQHLAAMGAYDLDRLPHRDVEIRFANAESDSFTPLAGRSDEMPLGPNVVVYASGTEIICYSFNHRDSKNTCLTSHTTAAVFFAEGVNETQVNAARQALEQMHSLLQQAGAKTGEINFVSASQLYLCNLWLD